VSHRRMHTRARARVCVEKLRILKCFIPLTVALDFAKSDVNRLSSNGGFLDAKGSRKLT